MPLRCRVNNSTITRVNTTAFRHFFRRHFHTPLVFILPPPIALRFRHTLGRMMPLRAAADAADFLLLPLSLATLRRRLLIFRCLRQRAILIFSPDVAAAALPRYARLFFRYDLARHRRSSICCCRADMLVTLPMARHFHAMLSLPLTFCAMLATPRQLRLRLRYLIAGAPPRFMLITPLF